MPGLTEAVGDLRLDGQGETPLSLLIHFKLFEAIFAQEPRPLLFITLLVSVRHGNPEMAQQGPRIRARQGDRHIVTGGRRK